MLIFRHRSVIYKGSIQIDVNYIDRHFLATKTGSCGTKAVHPGAYGCPCHYTYELSIV